MFQVGACVPSEKRRWIWVKAGTGQPEARREVRIRVRRRTHIVVQDLDVHGEGGHVGGEIRKAKWTEVILVEYELRRGKSERERESSDRASCSLAWRRGAQLQRQRRPQLAVSSNPQSQPLLLRKCAAGQAEHKQVRG